MMKIFFKNQGEPTLKLFNLAKMLITGVIFMLVSMSSGAATYYVTTSGLAKNPGTPGSPWSIAKAFSTAKAGDVVNIKGGNYGHLHLVVANSGSSGLPITFQAQANTGTPTLNGVNWKEKGISVSGKSYITLKGLRVKNYQYGIFFSNASHYATIDGCVADSCCNTDFEKLGYDGYGISITDGDHGKIKKCSATNNGGNNIFLSRSHYCTILNCHAYCNQTVNNKFMTDYYIVLAWSSHNVVRNCTAEDINGSYKGNHGIIIKDNPGAGGSEAHSTDNLIINCTAKKLEEGFVIAHLAYNNRIDSCYVDNTGKKSTFNFCFQIREGAHDNTISNCSGIAKTGGISVYDGTEGTNPQTQNKNLFVNCSIKGIL
ncbi:MAG: right-handed parallel beta-helix repeat-containing protein, partial [Bacteroidales bacterium]|nr:right-handed parallel beta-helix repeat-containing protein [Bacteroidales bacterium]